MNRKDSPQSVIDSYRRRQQMAPYFMAGLAVLLVVVGIIILVVWFAGSGKTRVGSVALFASPTPTVTNTVTPTPVTPTATATITITVTITPTITETATPSGPFEYKVQDGDTCWDIAAKHKIGLDVLLVLNNFGDTCPIKPGDTILGLPNSARLPSQLVADLLLRKAMGPPDERPQGLGVSLSFAVFEGRVDDVAERARRFGARLETEPRNQPWNARDFSIRDPDGFLLTFTQGPVEQGLSMDHIVRRAMGTERGPA